MHRLESIVAAKTGPFARQQSNWYVRCIGEAFGADQLPQAKRPAERKKEYPSEINDVSCPVPRSWDRFLFEERRRCIPAKRLGLASAGG